MAPLNVLNTAYQDYRTQFKTVPIRRIHPDVEKLVDQLCGAGAIFGGYARWSLSENDTTPTPSDIDIISPNEETHNSIVKWLRDVCHFRFLYESDNSVTFAPPLEGLEFCHIPYPVQVLKRFRGRDIEECVLKVDIDICQAYLYRRPGCQREGRLTIAALEAETNREICAVNFKRDVSDTLNTMKRLFKYSSRGYSINMDGVIDLIRQTRLLSASEWDNEIYLLNRDRGSS